MLLGTMYPNALFNCFKVLFTKHKKSRNKTPPPPIRETFSKITCDICEENTPFYKSICPQCFKDGIMHNNHVHNIKPYDLYKLIVTKLENETTDLYLLKEVIYLKRFLIKKISKVISYDSRLEIKCQCGNIIPRKNIKKSFDIKCHECEKIFCSNCDNIGHNEHFTCEKYQQIVDYFHNDVSEMWLAIIYNTAEQYIKFLKNKKEEEKMISEFEKYDLRICPYTDYDAASIYENHMIANGSINIAWTKKYTKENWDRVMCKSQPITKIRCSDVYCRQHNPEAVRSMVRDGIKVGENKNGCGRRINWKYWKQVDPKLHTSYVHFIPEKKDIIDATISSKIHPEYICELCTNKRTCMFIKCCEMNCNFLNKKICGQCINDLNKLHTMEQTIIITNVSTKEEYTFTRKKRSYFTCPEMKKPQWDDSFKCIMSWSETSKRWEIKTVFIDTWLGKKQFGIGCIEGLPQFITGSEKVVMKWYGDSETENPCEIISKTPQQGCSDLYRLFNFHCVKKKHLLNLCDSGLENFFT